MFDFLEDASSDQVTPAGYGAIQFINRWARESVSFEELAAFVALSPTHVELAKRIIAEIEAREGQSVAAVPLRKIDEYIRIISRKVLEASARDLHVDEAKGRMLLDELRVMS